MTRRSKIWLVVAVLFSLINLGGAVIAASRNEVRHASAHVALLLLGAYVVWQLIPHRIRRRSSTVPAALSAEFAERLTNIEHSVDAMAIEVERIGEGQRFITRLFTESRAPQARGDGVAQESEVGDGAAQESDTAAPETTPDVRRD